MCLHSFNQRYNRCLHTKAGLSHRISGGCGVVPVELDEVVEGDQDAHQVHQDPQEVQDIVPIWALHINNFRDEADNGHN